MSIGLKIKEIRKRKGWTQEGLAEEARINLRTIQRIEKGESEPRGKTLHLICTALGIQAEDLLDYGKQEDPTYLALVHLSVLIFLIIPLGNIILPLILWSNKRDKITGLQRLGVNLLNYQIVWTFLAFLSAIGFAYFKILHWAGSQSLFYVLIGLYALNVVLPLIFAYQANKGKKASFYPNLIPFIR